jgi:hypothetical protein
LGVDAEWQDEFGKARESLLDPRGLMMAALERGDLSHTACARFIDPYGDAVFNQAQIPVLAEELRALPLSDAAPEVQRHVEQLLALLIHAAGTAHTYVKFIGD